MQLEDINKRVLLILLEDHNSDDNTDYDSNYGTKYYEKQFEARHGWGRVWGVVSRRCEDRGGRNYLRPVFERIIQNERHFEFVSGGGRHTEVVTGGQTNPFHSKAFLPFTRAVDIGVDSQHIVLVSDGQKCVVIYASELRLTSGQF
ncbi:unnamed protein product [Medioppia subpectinata]|uniref:Uncharacterized protein n=1 Tax=Medioppia subpectinata TaxID=1979941 RepID=A0A7R9QHL3_9ACAR|nr:unnamed protein product [Medioppia subpectinata]CAG2120955.1 unnamed protein product [Medioppia subpectinata]